MQLSKGEHSKFMAWLAGVPYTPSGELVRVSLIEAQAWDTTSKVRDVFRSHRPEDVQCAQGTGWLVEDDALEIRTASCNYLSLTQQSLLNIASDTVLELAMSHSDLNFNAPSSAHVALSIAGTTIWETTIPIPSAGSILKETITLPFAVAAGDSIDVHLENHGNNVWTVHALDALISEDIDLEFCASFDSTWEAIQAVAFEKPGCTNSLCHGAAAAGGLDLSPDVAYDNLVGVASEASSLSRISPREPAASFLYHKLWAKTFSDTYAISGSPMPPAGPGLTKNAVEVIRVWIEAGAPETGSVGDAIGRGEDEIERLLGVCLPEAEPVNTLPLPPPQRDVGLQFKMPPHAAPSEQENEWCFAVYEDFRDSIPPEFMSPDREFYYAQGDEIREGPYTHHNILMYSGIPVEDIHHPSIGEWSCADGDQVGRKMRADGSRTSCGTRTMSERAAKQCGLHRLWTSGAGPVAEPGLECGLISDASPGSLRDASQRTVFSTGTPTRITSRLTTRCTMSGATCSTPMIVGSMRSTLLIAQISARALERHLLSARRCVTTMCWT